MPGISATNSQSTATTQQTGAKTQLPIKNSAINEIAYDSLKELAAALIITGASCCFVATPAIPSLLLYAIATVALNTLVRASVAGIKQAHCFLNLSAKSQAKELFLINYFTPYTFAILDLITRQVLVHEVGHALAANMVYKYANPKIVILPFSGGFTKFSPGPLTKLGADLGRTNSDLFVTMAGPMAGIFLSLVDLGIAHKVRDSNPELHRYLLCTAIMNIANHVIYALSALLENTSHGHDFAMLWKVGNIHPLTSAICMIAVPVIFQSGLALSEYLLK